MIIGHPEVPGAQLLIDELKLQSPDGTPVDAKVLLTRRDEKLLSTMAESRPMKGAVSLLASITEADIPIAVATSSSREYLPIKKKAAPEIFKFVKEECIVCGDDEAVRGKGKPRPDIFIEAAKRIGCGDDARSRSSCLAFEDAAAGVQAAKAAGMTVVVCPDHRLDKSLFKGADVIVPSLEGFDLGAVGAGPVDKPQGGSGADGGSTTGAAEARS